MSPKTTQRAKREKEEEKGEGASGRSWLGGGECRVFIMQVNKSASSNLIAGILFGIMALLSLVGLVQYFSIWNLLSLAALAYTAAMLLISRKDALLCGGFAVMALVDLISLATPYSNKFSLLLEFLGFAAMVVLVVAVTTNAMPAFRETAKKLWFVPAACLAVCALLALIQALQILAYGYGLHLSGFFGEVLVTVGCVFAGMWIASVQQESPAAPQYAAGTAAGSAYSGASGPYNAAGSTYSYQAASAPVTPASTMYCGLAKHVLLLLFTFGIWYLIWIYRATGYLNQVEDEPPRNPTTKLLLCMFVPFYGIYWTYKSAQRIDKLSAARGIPSDLSTLCLILAIFVAIIPPILMQDKINAILSAEGYTAPAGASYAAPQQPQQSAQPQQAAQQPRPNVSFQRPGTYIDVPEELKKYKELLDMGAITQEEFDAKKQQLLNL